MPTWLDERLASALEAGDFTWVGQRVPDRHTQMPLTALQWAIV